MKADLKILLVDDHLVVRKGIELILKEEFKSSTIFNSENYDEAIAIMEQNSIDLVLLDININGVENIKIMRKLKEIQPQVKILVFSSHDEKQYGLRYIEQGADGYLNKFCSEDKIVEAISFIVKKGYFYSETIKEKLVSKSKKKLSSNPIDSLSNREYEIATMLINGYGNLEIANKLDIQMSTVSTYKNRVFEKLNITNVVALSDLFKNSNQ
jgi:DNA-binding NarL/FixJ family response regulator